MSEPRQEPEHALSVALQQHRPFPLDVAFGCHAGEMLALIGPSGSGKSTVLRSIAGLHTVEQGLVSCAGQTWLDTRSQHDLSVQARGVGFVFQHYGLFPHKNALENVALAVPAHHPRRQRRSIAMSWLERTNMTGLELQNPHALSGGQKQRVALARALARDPSVLLLDEPFSAVDQQTRRRLYRELAQLRSGLDIPMILVTHDIHEVQQLADSLCLIHRGKSLQQGKVQTVFNRPETKEVAKLLGHQNLLPARVAKHDDQSTWYQLGNCELVRGPLNSLPAATTVTLLIAPSAITPRLEGNSDTPSINRLHGCTRDAVGMGDEWSLRVHLDNVKKSLRFRVPTHAVDAAIVIAGQRVSLDILSSGVHAIVEGSQT